MRVLIIGPIQLPSFEIGILQPFNYLKKKGVCRFSTRYEEHVTAEDVAAADVVIFCRTIRPQAYQFLELAHQMGKRTVYVIDDHLLAIHPTTEIGRHYNDPEIRRTFTRFIKNAQNVKVASKYFADHLRVHFNPQNIVCFTGSVDFSIIDELEEEEEEERKKKAKKSSRQNEQAKQKKSPKELAADEQRDQQEEKGEQNKDTNQFEGDQKIKGEQQDKQDKTIVIGYEGGRKEGSFTPVVPALRKILKKYEDNVRIEFIGYVPPELEGHKRVSYIKPISDYRNFLKLLYRRHWDIGLSPLEETLFHKCKTNNKFREYSACGIAGIYSSSPAYKDWVTHKDTGLLVPQTAEGWYTGIRRLIDDDDLRESIKENAKEYARKKFAIEKCADKWCKYILN